MSNKYQEIEESYQTSLASLDEFQRRAVESEAERIVIRAPAGAGKTHLLIAAVCAYRYNNLNDSICAITYTRAAREEMEGRLQKMGVHNVRVSTIHVWAREQLMQLAKKYMFKVVIIQESQIKSILSELVADYVRTSRIRSINLDILYNYVVGSKRMDITDNFRRTLNALDRRYINYKRNNNLYDFTDYPLYLYNMLNLYHETIDDVDALFVDEFQDVDSVQLQLFDMVRAHKKFYIGDAWQSIFQFRDADGAAFTKLNGFELYKLKRNYRSYQEIIDYATTVYLSLREKAALEEPCYISEIMWSHDSEIYCNRGYGAQLYVVNPYGRLYCGGKQSDLKTADLVHQFLKMHPMILCRTNKQVKAIQEMGYEWAETVHQAKGLEYPDVIVIDATINNSEDLNIAYVAITRAENNLLIINWQQLELLLKTYLNKLVMAAYL